ncbi:hypothetical protein [[Eubacterium] cellulosolvens]
MKELNVSSNPKNKMQKKHKNVLFFKDLKLSISEWCPFGQNAIQTFNDSIDSLKGIESSLLTGKVDEEPATSEFNIEPMFTRVLLKDFDIYNWIKFEGEIEYPEEVEQIERIGTYVDKSGFINYGLELERIGGKTSNFSLDETTAIVADLVEDTSIMMEALLTQFQRRILKVVYGDTPFRPKFIVAMSTGMVPGHDSAIGYHDGEAQENEINQLVSIAHKFFDLPTGEKVILGTHGIIFISNQPQNFGKVLSFYSLIRGFQLFQTIFFNRLRRMWDQIKDLRTEVLTIEREEAIGQLEQKLSTLGADVVLIEEVMGFMRAGAQDMQALWNMHSGELDGPNKALADQFLINRELRVANEKIGDMELVSSGLVDEIQGLRDMVNTLAEKRMREMNKLMSDNVQQGSDAQMAMAANVKASRYSGAALKILSMISAGALGMKISDLAMKAMDELNEDFIGLENPWTGELWNFWGGYTQVLVGVLLWIIFTLIFFKLIKASSDKMKKEKLAKDFVLQLRIPIDVRSTPEKITKYVNSKDIMFHNVELTGHRVSWYHKQKKGEDEIFYTLTMCYDAQLGHIHYVHANTEDKNGDALYTTNFLLKELRVAGLINDKQEIHIKSRMGYSSQGGENK